MEENRGFIYNLVEWIRSHKRRVWFIAVVTVGFMVGLYLFTTYALVFVEVSSDSESKNISVLTGTDIGDEKMNKAGGAGLLLLPRSTKSIVVANGEYVKTRINLQIPWYGFVEKKVSLHKDKNAKKIAYRSTTASTCALYRPGSDVLAYYSCLNPNAGLFEYKAPDSRPWSLKKIAPIYHKINHPEPGSHLGIIFDIDSSTGFITGIGKQNEKITYNAPATVNHAVSTQEHTHTDTSTTKFSQSRIFTDTSNTSNTKFVIVTITGDIFIGTPTGGSNVEYSHIEAPSDYNSSYNQTLCSLNNDFVYCYRGPSIIGDTPSDFDFSKVTQSQIITHSFTDRSEQTFTIPSNLFSLNKIHLTDKGELFGDRYNELYHFKKSGDSYETIKLAVNVSAVSAGDQLYYANKDGIYTLDDNDSSVAYQVFYSPNVQPRAIYPVDGKVFIIGNTPFDRATTYAYELTDEENISPGNRLIDLFPSEPKITEMVSNDLVGDRLNVRLNVPMRSADPGEVSRLKNAVIDRLQIGGTPIDPNRINFIY